MFGRDPSLPPRVKTDRPVARRLRGRHPHRDPRGRADRARRAAGADALGAHRGARPGPGQPLLHALVRGVRGEALPRQRDRAPPAAGHPVRPADPARGRQRATVRRADAGDDGAHPLAGAPARTATAASCASTQFPRSNDLGLFSEFAVANTVGGATELVREPLLRLENRYEGIGFVGDLADAATAVGPGWLSDSIHLPPLLEHVRGRLETRLDPAEGPRSVGRGEDVGFDITPGDERRAYALGFVVETIGRRRARALARARRRRAERARSRIALDDAGTYAGVVELDARPLLARRAVARVRSEGDAEPARPLPRLVRLTRGDGSRRHVRAGASSPSHRPAVPRTDRTREARLLQLNLAARRQTPPNAIGRGPLMAEPGFGVAIVAIVRNEARHLEEWLALPPRPRRRPRLPLRQPQHRRAPPRSSSGTSTTAS